MDVVPFVLGLVLVGGLLLVALIKFKGMSRKEDTSKEEDASKEENASGETTSQVGSSGSMGEDTTMRFIVLLVFAFAFCIGIIGSLYFLSALPPGFSSAALIGLFLYMFLLNVCFLAVVYWVAKDGETIENMRNRIIALEKDREQAKEED
jgi:hypothetical protein